MKTTTEKELKHIQKRSSSHRNMEYGYAVLYLYYSQNGGLQLWCLYWSEVMWWSMKSFPAFSGRAYSYKRCWKISAPNCTDLFTRWSVPREQVFEDTFDGMKKLPFVSIPWACMQVPSMHHDLLLVMCCWVDERKPTWPSFECAGDWFLQTILVFCCCLSCWKTLH